MSQGGRRDKKTFMCEKKSRVGEFQKNGGKKGVAGEVRKNAKR